MSLTAEQRQAFLGRALELARGRFEKADVAEALFQLDAFLDGQGPAINNRFPAPMRTVLTAAEKMAFFMLVMGARTRE